MDKIFKKPLTRPAKYGIIQVSQGRWIKAIERRDAFHSVDREEPEKQDRKAGKTRKPSQAKITKRERGESVVPRPDRKVHLLCPPK